MNYEDLKKLEDLKVDDFIWYIYIFIIFAALFSNSLEKEYVISKNKKKATEFHTINIIVLTIAFLIYIFFTLRAGEEFKNSKDIRTTFSFIGTILFLVAGGIFLWVEVLNTDYELGEIAI